MSVSITADCGWRAAASGLKRDKIKSLSFAAAKSKEDQLETSTPPAQECRNRTRNAAATNSSFTYT